VLVVKEIKCAKTEVKSSGFLLFIIWQIILDSSKFGRIVVPSNVRNYPITNCSTAEDSKFN